MDSVNSNGDQCAEPTGGFLISPLRGMPDDPGSYNVLTKRNVMRMAFGRKAKFALLICVVIALLGLGIFLALYFTGTASSSTSANTPSTGVTVGTSTRGTIAPPLSGPVTVKMTLTIQKSFMESYNNPESSEYKQLENVVVTMMDDIYRSDNVLSGVYEGTEVISFSNGSVTARLKIVFRDLILGAHGIAVSIEEFVDTVQQVVMDVITQPDCCGGLVIDNIITTPEVPITNNPPTATRTNPATVPTTVSTTASPTVEVTPCEPYSCNINGTCTFVGPDEDDFICECLSGFQGEHCEVGTLHLFVGENEAVQITSPGYPGYYPPHTNMTWIITTTRDSKIHFNLDKFVTYDDAYTFKVGDGTDPGNVSTAFFSWNGYSSPPNLLSNGNTAWVRFTSKYHHGEGILVNISSTPTTGSLTCRPYEFDCGHDVCIAWTHVCDGHPRCIDESDEKECDACNTSSSITLNFKTSVSIFSEPPPHKFVNTNCEWYITAPNNAHIIIDIYEYDLQANNYVTVVSGHSPLPQYIGDENTRLLFLSAGTHPIGRVGFPVDTLAIYVTNKTPKSRFHLGIQAVQSDDYIPCETYPYVYLLDERCDRIVQCPAYDDEVGCDCTSDEYQCGNGLCVSPATAECNGIMDCPDFSDEGVLCNNFYCTDIDNGTECGSLLAYNKSYFPNDFATFQELANDVIVELSNCTDEQKLTLCMSLFPECPRFGSAPRVCASTCMEALTCAGPNSTSSVQCDFLPNQIVDNRCAYDDDDILQVGECGLRPAPSPTLNPHSPVVGGAAALIVNWPWMASLQASRSDGCAATLINTQWVVTAAHCSEAFDRIVFGSSKVHVPSDYPHIRRVAKVILHPGYTGSTFDNDIALLKLSSPIEYSDTIQPACVGFEEFEEELYGSCYVLGWGRSATEYSPGLKETRIELQPLEECLQNRERRFITITSKQICGTRVIGPTISRIVPPPVDSGGPVLCQSTNGRWKLVGITGTSFMGGNVSVQTRVSSYIDFIRYTIASDIVCKQDQFQCTSGDCINQSQQCDTVSDCDDGGDESDCDFGFVRRTIFIGMNETAEITSPLYPSEYPTDVRITWEITTTEGNNILLAFESFSTELSVDELWIAGSLTFRKSGSPAWPVLRSQGSTVEVFFTSDSSVSGRGFVIKVACVPSVVVPEEITLNSNETTTIHYPSYAKYWNITADTYRIIRFDFVPLENQTSSILIAAGYGRNSYKRTFFTFLSSSRTSKTVPRFALSKPTNEDMWFAVVYFGASVDSGAPIANVRIVPGTDHVDCFHEEYECGRYCIPESWVCDGQPDCVSFQDERAFCVN